MLIYSFKSSFERENRNLYCHFPLTKIICDFYYQGLVDSNSEDDFYNKLATLRSIWDEREKRFLGVYKEPSFFSFINDKVYICYLTFDTTFYSRHTTFNAQHTTFDTQHKGTLDVST